MSPGERAAARFDAGVLWIQVRTAAAIRDIKAVGGEPPPGLRDLQTLSAAVDALGAENRRLRDEIDRAKADLAEARAELRGWPRM